MGASRILLVDDESSILSVLSTLLKAESYDVVTVLGGEEALTHLGSESFHLVITDIRMNPITGMDVLREVHEKYPGTAVIMMTAYGSVETAVDALKMGAFDYVTKPFKIDELLITVQRALEYNRALTENEDLRSRLQTDYRFENIVAESPAMRNVCDMIERVAPTDTTILISGESGTGKELVAQAIHSHSLRKKRKFLAVNCAALPEPLLESEMFGHVKGAFTGAALNKDGLFEAANGGTIFLDEVGSMPLSIQGKLLRVLQEKEIRRVGSNKNIPVDARVLAATNRDLRELIAQGTFREDLYYRLSVIPIEIKPLRERREDILPITYRVLKNEIGEGPELPVIEPAVRQVLEGYDWPGNVRELENAMKHALMFARGNKISVDALPPKIANAAQAVIGATGSVPGLRDEYRGRSLRAFLREKEGEYLAQVMEHVGGDKERAAKALKISLATLYRKLPPELQ